MTTSFRFTRKGVEETETDNLFPHITRPKPLAKNKLMFFTHCASDQNRRVKRYIHGTFKPSEIQLRLSLPGMERRYNWPFTPAVVHSNHSRRKTFREQGITPFHCSKTQVSVFYKGEPMEPSALYTVAIPIVRLKRWIGMSPRELYMAGEAGDLRKLG